MQAEMAALDCTQGDDEAGEAAQVAKLREEVMPEGLVEYASSEVWIHMNLTISIVHVVPVDS